MGEKSYQKKKTRKRRKNGQSRRGKGKGDLCTLFPGEGGGSEGIWERQKRKREHGGGVSSVAKESQKKTKQRSHKRREGDSIFPWG